MKSDRPTFAHWIARKHHESAMLAVNSGEVSLKDIREGAILRDRITMFLECGRVPECQ